MAETFRYPRKRIDALDDYLQILVVKYTPPGVETSSTNLIQKSSTQALAESGNLKNPLFQILLPMPQGISDSNMVSWGDDTLNPLAAAGVGAAETAMEGNPIKSVQDFIGAAKNVATSGNAQNAVTSFMAAMAVNNFGANVSGESILARSEGKILNPNMELLFKGVQLRSFNFTFNMAPRDDLEAGSVKNIIRTFKKSMSARTSSGAGAGLFIDSPNIFQLEYRSGNGKHPFLNSFKPCALTNMAVDYTASGTYATYEDATPVHMKLTLSFQELNPVYFSDYDDLNDIGVGY
jgi:hypothetical protein